MNKNRNRATRSVSPEQIEAARTLSFRTSGDHALSSSASLDFILDSLKMEENETVSLDLNGWENADAPLWISPQELVRTMRDFNAKRGVVFDLGSARASELCAKAKRVVSSETAYENFLFDVAHYMKETGQWT